MRLFLKKSLLGAENEQQSLHSSALVGVCFPESVAPNTPSRMMPKIYHGTGSKSLIVNLIERFYSL